MVCKKGNAEDLAFILSQVVDPKAYSPDLRLKTLEWLANAARINKVKPAGDLAAVKGLLSDPQAAKNPAFALAVIRLAALWQVPEMGAELKSILDSTQDASLQFAALEGLRTLGGAGSRAAIQELATGSDSTATRFAASAALAQFDLDAAASAAAAALAKASPQDDSAKLMQAFLDRKQGSETLAAKLANTKLASDVAKRALRTMYSVGRSDQALSDVLSKAAGIATDVPPPTGAALVKLCDEVMLKGNAARGEQVFRRTDLNCMKCHSVSGGGGNIGPDLSPVGGSSPIDYVVTSILNPNLAIKELYVTRNFVTSDGLQLSGIVVDRNDQQVKLKDASGQIITVPTADIEQEAEGQSLMPQGLTKFLTHDEFLDLAKFVSELGKPGPYAVRSRQTVQRWRVLSAPSDPLKAEVPNIEILREHVLRAPAEAWQPAYGKVAGALPLEELRAATGQSVLYLQGDLEVLEAGPIGLRVHCDRPHQIWIDATPIQSGESVVSELSKSPHTITLRIELDDKQAPEISAEFFTPNGSKAEFVAK
jgi:putative heme-binding domain-containing protein